jgi:hypothetical protein
MSLQNPGLHVFGIFISFFQKCILIVFYNYKIEKRKETNPSLQEI